MNTISVQQLPNEELVLEINDGNVPLFELLIRRLNLILYKIGRGYGLNHQDTEDLMQDAFIIKTHLEHAEMLQGKHASTH
jgi:hypothetical protein